MKYLEKVIILLMIPLWINAQSTTVDTLKITSSSALPGDTVTLLLELYNNQDSIAGLQASIRFPGISLDSIFLSGRAQEANMSLSSNIWDDSARIVIISLQGNAIGPGRGEIARLQFSIPDTMMPGDSVYVDIDSVVLSDPHAQHIPSVSIGGWTTIPPSDTIRVLSTFGAPGMHISIPLELVNDTPISGIQTTLLFDNSVLSFSDTELDSAMGTFTIFFNSFQDSVKLVVLSTVGDSIIPGTHTICYLNFVVDTNAALGDSTYLEIQQAVLSDPHSNHIPVARVGDWIFIRGVKGDLNQDGIVDIVDAVREVNIIIGKPPVPTPYELWAGDMDDNGIIDVADAVAIVNVILGRGKSGIPVVGNAVLWSENGGILIDSDCEIAGIQFDILGDISELKLGKRAKQMKLLYNPIEGGYRVVIIGLDGSLLPAGRFMLLNFKGRGELARITVVDRNARKLKLSVIKQIILKPIVPNPIFNEGFFEFALPKKMKVKMVIYNLTGRRVKQIINREFESGVHKVKINASEFTSGIYFLRMEAGNKSIYRKFIVK